MCAASAHPLGKGIAVPGHLTYFHSLYVFILLVRQMHAKDRKEQFLFVLSKTSSAATRSFETMTSHVIAHLGTQSNNKIHLLHMADECL